MYPQQFKMKKTLLLISMLFCIKGVSYSQANVNNKDSLNRKDTLNRKAANPKDRNMFGIGIPRGLTINSDGLASGYVMFAVPNSASVYLIDRKGEVVHEWKGNYGANASVVYLNNDGSIVRNAADPDFPVFAGGGESGRLQKI